MRRRDFMRVMVVGAAGWPLSIRAEQPAQAALIGVLFANRADDPFSKWFTTGFARLMKERGSLPSPNFEIQYRFSDGDTDATRASARELIGMRPAVILASSNTSMAALHLEATGIPVVFFNVSDPVGMGYVESLSRPGHSVTGLTPFVPSLGSKWLSFLKELAPSIEDVGVIFNPEPGNNSGSFLRAIESAAPLLAIKRIVTPLTNSADIERTIVDLGNSSRSGLVFLPDAFTYARRNEIAQLIAKHRIPAIYPWRDFVTAGGLISYGPPEGYRDEIVRQAANYVGRILSGEKPAEMPVQAPTKLVIAINARAAKTLGLEIPASLMALADEVIE
jgi:putative tryptophan/tyrosine transport system substrate-binding protein